MNEFLLPDDFVAFHRQGARARQTPTECEAGRVRLIAMESLVLRAFAAQSSGTPVDDADPHSGESGCYQVPGIDLIRTCSGDYDPEGLLVWFPGERSFGVWDPDHDHILLFGANVSWTTIAADLTAYVNAQWDYPDMRRAPTAYIEPWGKYPFL